MEDNIAAQKELKRTKANPGDAEEGPEAARTRLEAKIANLALEVVEVKQDPARRDEEALGEEQTLLAAKNGTSYLIATQNRGIEVVEGSKPLYRKTDQNSDFFNDFELSDVVYAASIDGYLISANKKLYRKDLDEKDPYEFLGREVGSLAYSEAHNSVVVSVEGGSGLGVVDLATKKLKILEIENGDSEAVETKIGSFRLVGDDQEHVVATTFDGRVLLYSLKAQKQVFGVDLNLKPEEAKNTILAVHGAKPLAFVAVKQATDSPFATRILVFEISVENQKLTQKASCDLLEAQIGALSALEHAGDAGDSRILLVGVGIEQGLLHVFDLNLADFGLTEHSEKRAELDEDGTLQLVKVGDAGNGFLYTGGSEAKVLHLRVVC